MKKLILALLVTFGLQTQAQINNNPYCDSLEISMVQGGSWCNLDVNASNFNWANTPTTIQYDWTVVDWMYNWVAWDSTDSPNFYITPNSPNFDDTLYICLTVTVWDSLSGVQIANCYNLCTDEIVWDGANWNLLSSVTPQPPTGSFTSLVVCDSYTWGNVIYYSTGIYWQGYDTLDLTVVNCQSSCDSVEYHVMPNQALLQLEGWSNDPDLTITDFYWQVCDDNMCYGDTGSIVYFPQVMTTDTIKVCLDIIGTNNFGTTVTCTQCDTLVYGFNGWMRMMMSSPTSINEMTLYNTISDNKIYDMLGREVNDVVLGTMYIRNGKKYIQIK